jgi:hypothetical protein
MSQTGSTFGGSGSPSYNLSSAQFQQRVSDAERQCRKCGKGQRYCRALVNARYNRCPAEKCGDFREDSCALAAAAALQGCPTRSCTSSVCGKCPCKECVQDCSSSSSSKSCCKSSSKTPTPIVAK